VKLNPTKRETSVLEHRHIMVKYACNVQNFPTVRQNMLIRYCLRTVHIYYRINHRQFSAEGQSKTVKTDMGSGRRVSIYILGNIDSHHESCFTEHTFFL
jgi:hypothetical protein